MKKPSPPELVLTRDGNTIRCTFPDGRELVVVVPKHVTYGELERFVEHLEMDMLSHNN